MLQFLLLIDLNFGKVNNKNRIKLQFTLFCGKKFLSFSIMKFKIFEKKNVSTKCIHKIINKKMFKLIK